jgi:hypothetical protein
MSKKQERVFWPSLALIALAVGTVALVKARTRTISNPAVTSAKPGAKSEATASSIQAAQTKGAKTNDARPRNLSLQPEAFNMGRRLGGRFAPGKRGKSVLIGTLTIGSERRIVQTTRTQTDDGEEVEIKTSGSPGSLTWDSGQGALSSSSRATGSDRDLIERLVLDSPDQFVLAQLRGASYYTVARNVRPAEADDNYAGPLWNIVRVDDPQRDDEKKPQSTWRLYYVNTRTGLIDRVVSQLRGETIEAEISGWTTLSGENMPSQITWTSRGQTLMTYGLANFSYAEK